MKPLACAVLFWSTLAACDHAPEPPAIDAAVVLGDASTGTPDAGSGRVYTIDPDTLVFYDLPINSIRYAVSGLEPTHQVCVTLVWTINEYSEDEYRLCGLDRSDGTSNPYALVAPAPPAALPDQPPGCQNWDYGPNATVEDVTGCAVFRYDSMVVGSADLVVTLDSPLLRGDVIIRGP